MKNKDNVFDIESFLSLHKVDAFLISNYFNVLYLSHFEGLSLTEREAFVFITKKGLYLITDGRYASEKHILPFFTVLITDADHSVSSFIQSLCIEKGITTVGFEAGDLSWREADTLSKIPVLFTPVNEPLSRLRQQKTHKELQSISKACGIADNVLNEVIPYIIPGVSERKLAWQLEMIVREKYNAEIAFDPMVAVDSNASLPHYNTKKGGGVIKNNSLLLLDFGVKWDNYCSDITRMVAVGAVGDEMQNAYNILKSVQENARNKITACTELSEIDLYCHAMLEKNGFPLYPHSTGHGTGLEVHEGPKVNFRLNDKKEIHQVFTIEPGIYIPNRWGMRLEDTGYITSLGEFRDLTQFPRELIQV